MAPKQLMTVQRMGLGFTGVLFLAGVTFYIAKRSIAERRKVELDEYRAARLSNNQNHSPKS